MLFQKNRVQFLAPTWKLATVYNSNSKGSDTHTDIHAGKTLVQIILTKEKNIFWVFLEILK